MTIDGYVISRDQFPIRLTAVPGRHSLVIGKGPNAAELPLYLGPGRAEVFVSETSRAVVVWPAASHLALGYSQYTAVTGPETFASFQGWLGPSLALVVLTGRGSFAWDLTNGTLNELWPIAANWVSDGGRWLSGVDRGRLLIKDLETGEESLVHSWDPSAPWGAEASSVLAGSPEGEWFAVAVFGPHDEPAWPSVWLFRPGTGLEVRARPSDFQALVPGYVPVDRIRAGGSTLFVCSRKDRNGSTRLVRVAWPDGLVTASEPITNLPGVLRPCGVRDGRLILVGLEDGEAVTGSLWSYDPANHAVERLELETGDVAVFGAVNPVTGSLWLGLKQGDVAVSLTEVANGASATGDGRLTFPVSTTGLALSWSPDGIRGVIADALGATGLLICDPRGGE